MRLLIFYINLNHVLGTLNNELGTAKMVANFSWEPLGWSAITNNTSLVFEPIKPRYTGLKKCAKLLLNLLYYVW